MIFSIEPGTGRETDMFKEVRRMRKVSIYRGVLLVFSLAVLFHFGIGVQSDLEKKPVPERWRVGFESIVPNESQSFLEFIAADELEGRDTASVGQSIARNYIKSLYQVWGVKPGAMPKGPQAASNSALMWWKRHSDRIWPSKSDREIQRRDLCLKKIFPAVWEWMCPVS